METTTLFRARVPAKRLRRAERVFGRLGMRAGDAFNLFLAQVELRGDLPFVVTTKTEEPLMKTVAQGKVWEEALGEY